MDCRARSSWDGPGLWRDGDEGDCIRMERAEVPRCGCGERWVRFAPTFRNRSRRHERPRVRTPARHDPFAALRQPDFLLFSFGRFTATAGQGMLHAAIAWQVYLISGSALQLGMLGLVRLVPQLLAALYAGAVADSFDRKRIVLLAQIVPVGCSAILLATTVAQTIDLRLIYMLVLATALANAFENPARQALLPSIVRRETFQNAITVSQTIQSLASVSGPALAGVTIAFFTVSGAYAAHVVLLVISIIGIALLHPRPIEGERRAVSMEAIKEGLQFVWHRQILLGSMTLDLFAVIFGGATALLPVYATTVLHVGSVGYGILVSSLDAGALVAAVILVAVPQVQHTGRVLMYSIAAFGLGTVVFGLSTWFPLSVAAYMFIGMADQVGLVMRHTTVQLATPDALRGRVSSVSGLFSGTSNQLGAVESGFVAAATSAVFAVVSGGIGCLAVLGVVAVLIPELRSYRVDDVARAEAESPAAS